MLCICSAWINVLAIAALGLCRNDDVVRVAVSLPLGVPLCSPHKCSGCRADSGLSCQLSKGHHLHCKSLNGIIWRSLGSAKVPCHFERSGLFRSDGKRPDGGSLVPWKAGKALVWEVTHPNTLAPPSHAWIFGNERTRSCGYWCRVQEDIGVWKSFFIIALCSHFNGDSGSFVERSMLFSQGGCSTHWKGIRLSFSITVSNPAYLCS